VNLESFSFTVLLAASQQLRDRSSGLLFAASALLRQLPLDFFQ
jgi:hypothetical protein